MTTLHPAAPADVPDTFQRIDCPVCASDRHHEVLTVRYGQLKQKASLDYGRVGITAETPLRVVRCADCGLVFVNPRLRPECEAAVYNECKAGLYAKASDDEAKAAEARKRRTTYLGPLLEALAHIDPKRGRPVLFDYGCGFGYCMEMARALGLETHGVDIDETRLALCREKGLRVDRPDRIDAAGAAVRADVVLWMSNIEHLFDLRAGRDYVAAHCAPGAVLYVNGLTPAIIQNEWKTGRFVRAHFVEHINYFPRSTLDRFLGESGFVPLPKTRMALQRSLRDALRGVGAFLADRFFGGVPGSGNFARLYRYQPPAGAEAGR